MSFDSEKFKGEGLTYDDVLLVPAHSKVLPRETDLSTKLSDELNLDPADRIIAATSIISNTPLITADKNLQRATKLNIIW